MKKPALTVIIAALAACSTAPEDTSRRLQELPELPISIEVAEAATIQFEDPNADYVLVNVTFNAEQFGIYAGNSPNTPQDPAKSTDISAEVGARYPVYCSTSSSEFGESGHCLVDLRQKLDSPWYLHFFYNEFEPRSVKEVLAVIASVRVLESEGL